MSASEDVMQVDAAEPEEGTAQREGTVIALDRRAEPPAFQVEPGILRRRRDRGRHLGLGAMLALTDLSAMTAGWGVGLLVPLAIPGGERVGTRLVWALAAVTLGMALLASQRLYRPWVYTVRAIEIQRLGRVAVLTGVLLVAAARLADVALPGPQAIAGTLASFALLVVARSWYRTWLRSRRSRGRYVQPVVLIGAGDEAVELDAIMREHPEFGFRIAGVVGPRGEAARIAAPWLGELSEAVLAVRTSEAASAFVVASDMPAGRLNDIVRDLLEARVHVHLSSGLRGIAHHRLRALPLAHEPLFYLERASLARWQRGLKRLVDLVGAILIGVVTLPLLAAAAIAIWLESPGPLLVRQERIGRQARRFTLYTLRLVGDARVTRVGRVLQATGMDQLPQLFNVLTGSMSLVGPRPALPEEARRFDDRHHARFRLRPGVSGLWRVESHGDPAAGRYRRLDLFYVENWSIGLDLSILLASVFAVAARGFRLITLSLGRHAVVRAQG